MEAIFKGQKGDQGEQGQKGERGMPAAQLRAIVYLAVLTLLLAGANLLWTGHEVNASRAVQAREQAMQQRQGEVIGRKLCKTLDSLAALRPPGGSPEQNPSRAYEQALHAVLDRLAPDIGCHPGR